MPINFPTSPTNNQVYTYQNKSWIWDGNKWNILVSTSLQGIQGLQGTEGEKNKVFFMSTGKPNGTSTYSTNIPAGSYFVAFNQPDATATIGSYFIPTSQEITLPSLQSSITLSETTYFYPFSWNGKNWYNYSYGNPCYGAGKWIMPDTYQVWYTSDYSTYNWTSTAGSGNIRSLIFVNNLFVGGGDSGYIATSTDGITWTSRTSGFASTINAVTYGNGLYVAAGESGAMATSTDAVTWTTQTSGFGTSGIKTLMYGNGLYVAGGQSGTITTSTDTITWTPQTSGFGTSYIYSSVYNNSLYIIAGDAGKIATSTDGVTWTSRTSNTTYLICSIAFNGSNKILAKTGSTTQIISSTDGITWTSRIMNATAGFNGGGGSLNQFIAYGNGVFVSTIYKDAVLYSSTDSDGIGTNINPIVSQLINLNQTTVTTLS